MEKINHKGLQSFAEVMSTLFPETDSLTITPRGHRFDSKWFMGSWIFDIHDAANTSTTDIPLFLATKNQEEATHTGMYGHIRDILALPFVPSPSFQVETLHHTDLTKLAEWLHQRNPTTLDPILLTRYVTTMCQHPDRFLFIVAKDQEKGIIGCRLLFSYDTHYVQGYMNFVEPEYRRFGLAKKMLLLGLSIWRAKQIFLNQSTQDGKKFCESLHMSPCGHFREILPATIGKI